MNYFAIVSLLSFHLCVDELIWWFHGIHVWLGIGRNHIVKLESKGEEPAVDIWVGEKQKYPHGVSGPRIWHIPRKQPRVMLQGVLGVGWGCGGCWWESQQVQVCWELLHRMEVEHALGIYGPLLGIYLGDVTKEETMFPDPHSTATLSLGPTAS